MWVLFEYIVVYNCVPWKDIYSLCCTVALLIFDSAGTVLKYFERGMQPVPAH